MKADKLVGKTIEMVEYFEDCNMHLMFTDGTCLSVFAKDTDEVDVIYEGEVIHREATCAGTRGLRQLRGFA